MDENHPKAPATLKLQNKRTFASSHNIYKIEASKRTKDCESLHAQQVCLSTVQAASVLLFREAYWWAEIIDKILLTRKREMVHGNHP